MTFHLSRRFVSPLLLTLGLLALAATPSVAPAAPAIQADPAQGRTFTYLPVVVRTAFTNLQFATGVDEATDEPTGVTDTFPAGTDIIFVAWSLQDLQGKSYRLEFTYADGETLTTSTRVAFADYWRDWSAFCITTEGSCDSGRVTLPAGSYSARLFVEGRLTAERQTLLP